MRNVVKLVFSFGSLIAVAKAFPLENDAKMAKRFQKLLNLLDPYGQPFPTKSYPDSAHTVFADLLVGRPSGLLNFERKSGNNNKYLKKFLTAGEEEEVRAHWLKKLLRLHTRGFHMEDPMTDTSVQYFQKRKLSSDNHKINLFDFGAFKNMMGKGNEQNFLDGGESPPSDVDLKSFWDWLATDHGDSDKH